MKLRIGFDEIYVLINSQRELYAECLYSKKSAEKVTEGKGMDFLEIITLERYMELQKFNPLAVELPQPMYATISLDNPLKVPDVDGPVRVTNLKLHVKEGLSPAVIYDEIDFNSQAEMYRTLDLIQKILCNQYAEGVLKFHMQVL